MPKGAYSGGITNIVNIYMNNIGAFMENNICVSLLNFMGKRKIKFSSKVNNIVDAFFERKYILKEILKKPEAVLHIQTSRKWLLLKDLLLTRYLKQHTNNKIGITIHFCDVDKILYNNNTIKKIELYLLKRYVDFIIVLSKKTKEELGTLGVPKSKITVLYTFHGFEPAKEHIPNEGCKHLLYVGSIDRRKGIIDLLSTAKDIEQDFVIHICGKITDETIRQDFERLLNELKDKVKFHGYIDGVEKKALFAKSDILVLPSYGEGMPVVIMEGMAAGCAIISTNVGAIPEIIEEGRNGLLVNPGDRKALKEAILKCILYQSKLEDIQKNNITESLKYTTIEHIRQLSNFYNSYEL